MTRKPYIPVTEEEINLAFAGTNFGGAVLRRLLALSVLKKALNYHCGHTITQIMVEMKLTTPKGRVTDRGRYFCYDELEDKHHSPIGPEDTLPIEITTLTRYDADKGATGVYFLFRNGECVYVGQSENVHVRVREHRLTKNNQKNFDSYAFLPVVPERLSEVEYHYIALLSPKLNSLGRPDLKVARKLRRLMPKDQRQVVQAQLAELRSNIGDTRLLASI